MSQKVCQIIHCATLLSLTHIYGLFVYGLILKSIENVEKGKKKKLIFLKNFVKLSTVRRCSLSHTDMGYLFMGQGS